MRERAREVEDRRGKIQGCIVEKKGGASSWVRLGAESLTLFLEGLNLCIKGVSDVEGKRFCIFVPRGRRDKKGWTIMAEKLKQVLGFFGKNPEKYKGKVVEKVAMGGSYATMRAGEMDWGEDDIEKWGKFWAKSWDLKGNLGLAKLNKRKALLEFEDLEEARQVVSSGSCTWEGTQVRLEHWSPRSGCWDRGEERRDVWVRIVGLPISLWSPEILRRVGDACGGFITADENTRSMRDLQWARILVKWGGEAKPNVDEVDRQSREVWGEEDPRAGQRVRKGWGSGRLEMLHPSDDGRCCRGRVGSDRDQSKVKPVNPHSPEAEFFAARENEDTRKLQGGMRLTETDRALEEESMRYGKGFFDHSGDLDEEGRADKSLWLTVYKACNERIKECKELGGIHCNSDKGREMEVVGDIDDAQVVRSELEGNWEESGLARFSKFLGFPTEGLEKEILNFLTKIRKRREKIHSKELLEKSKFERELKRLECSINYEGGLKQKGSVQGQRAPNCSCPMKVKILSWNVRGANDSSKRKVIKTFIRNQRVDLMCIQETKVQCMTDSIARSIGSGRFLGWKAVNAEGASGGIFICWDRRALDMLDWEEGMLYGKSLGAIRGLWEDPWCIGGDFNITLFSRERSGQRRISLAMRNFAEIVDDLGLVDLPLQGGDFTWNGGLHNQSWARLDRFLVSPSWIDQFSGINQCRLPRPVSDHFPIMLVGGGIRRGLAPFRFENMWLKAEGFKELVRSWWQGIDVRGSASYKLATKMKEIKQKLKVWNREVFGKLERQQICSFATGGILG
ncbi:hypothetical protein CK203_028314 [Vitis vinifera]|uniref:DUF4283 domain-containing protein n=1 Tax=Vitis vinifera TaxID=29760 RepID=A0A438IZY0_VITVI|nr:hypothetical protein CK203_028314 [Vitis vinifera]